MFYSGAGNGLRGEKRRRVCPRIKKSSKRNSRCEILSDESFEKSKRIKNRRGANQKSKGVQGFGLQSRSKKINGGDEVLGSSDRRAIALSIGRGYAQSTEASASANERYRTSLPSFSPAAMLRRNLLRSLLDCTAAANSHLPRSAGCC